MKMLTIHNHQASEPDFCWGVEGEIAIPTPAPLVCHRPDCGCDRSHGGLNSHKASTTLMVRDVDLDFDDLVTACVGYLEAAGWADLIDEQHEVEALAQDMVADGAEIAAGHAAGTVLRTVFDRDDQQWRTAR
jgi:hypothetical protein